MFSETKSIKDFCLEIGSVDSNGTPEYALREHPEKKYDDGTPVRHILFSDAQKSKAMVARNLTKETIGNANALQVSWFEPADSDNQGFMVHGIGTPVEYATTVFKITV